LRRYSIDIAALSETRFHGETQIEEVGAGYTFFLIGHPADGPTQAGVGFAVRSTLLQRIHDRPVGHSPRLMTLTLELEGGHMATLISAYAPTAVASEDTKDEFYAQLNDIISRTPYRHKLILLGDFNARVGTNHVAWKKVLGRYGVGNENSNGSRLLQLCSVHELSITNTFSSHSVAGPVQTLASLRLYYC